MHLLTITIKIVLAFYLLDKLCLWLERKGYLYYRNEKREGDVCGGVLQELNHISSKCNRKMLLK